MAAGEPSHFELGRRLDELKADNRVDINALREEFREAYRDLRSVIESLTFVSVDVYAADKVAAADQRRGTDDKIVAVQGDVDKLDARISTIARILWTSIAAPIIVAIVVWLLTVSSQ